MSNTTMKTVARDAYGTVIGSTNPITWGRVLISFVDAVGGGWYRLTLADNTVTRVTRDEFAAFAKAA